MDENNKFFDWLKKLDFSVTTTLLVALVLVSGSTYLFIHYGKFSNSHAATDPAFIAQLLNEPDTAVMIQNAKNAGLTVVIIFTMMKQLMSLKTRVVVK